MRGEHASDDDVGIVLIGRNEGLRLQASIASLGPWRSRAVYVDSGSTDGSQEFARSQGLYVVDLDTTIPFTAARARNAGFRALVALYAQIKFVQFIDGDCILSDGWIEAGRRFLAERTEVALVCGDRAERFPEASIYNAMCHREFSGSPGPITECGGDVMLRASALRQVGGYREELIAGEEPELCVRLVSNGWKLWRLEEHMTRHDVAMTRFSQWWRRTKRAGHAYAEVSHLHWNNPNRIWVRNMVRALGWSSILPISLVLSLVFGPAALLLLLAYPLGISRMAMRIEAPPIRRWVFSGFTMLGKFPESLGILSYHLRRLMRQPSRIMEYK